MAWLDVITPVTGDSDNTGNTGYTFRIYIQSNKLSNIGLPLLRAAFFSAASEGLYISKAYVGIASADDNKDFTAAPTQLLFSGNAFIDIAANSYAYCDSVAFSIAVDESLLFSVYIETGKAAADSYLEKAMGEYGWKYYYKSGDYADVVDLTTGWGAQDQALLGVLRVEAALANAPIPVFMNQYRQRR